MVEAVDFEAYIQVGGLIGTAIKTTVRESYTTGAIGGWQRVGGLVGSVRDGLIADSYSTVSVYAGDSQYGLLFGELAGRVERTYAVSSSGPSILFGVRRPGGLIEGSFFDCTIMDTCGAEHGEATSAMQTQNLYTAAGWDFDTLWGFTSTEAYPCLRWQPGCGCVTGRDSDGDSTLDCSDECSADASKTVPGVCGCGVADADQDSDETLDCQEACPADPDKTEPGVCGCGAPDVDTDEDWLLDCNDPDSPVLIHDCDELQSMEQNLQGAYQLANDIECTDFDSGDGYGWRPVGSSEYGEYLPFTGFFDGAGHVITGLSTVRWWGSEIGLFGLTEGATVQRVGLEDVSFKAYRKMGGLVGKSVNTSVSESYVRGTLLGDETVGGLIGYMFGGQLRDSYGDVVLTANAEYGLLVGRLAGSANRNYSSGDSEPAKLIGAWRPGGLLESTFYDCEAAGNCSGDGGESTQDMQTQPLYTDEG